MKRTATILAALAVAFAVSAATVRTATETFVTNRIAAAVAAIPAPDYSTNNAALVATIEATAPHQSLWPAVAAATNYTDAALGAFAATGSVARAAAYGTPTRWTDATGCVWEVGTELSAWSFSDGLDRAVVYGGFYEWLGWPVYGEDVRGTDSSDYAWFMSQAEATNATRFVYVKADGSEVTATRTEYEATNLVGRVVLTSDLAGAVSMDVSKTTDESKLLNAPSLQSARVVPDPVQSAYWPNRQRVLRLGDDETVVTADKAEVRVLLVRDPTRLIFIDEATVDGEGQTNYTFKTFQQYLNAVSPDAMQEVLRSYLPVEGGGSVTGNVSVTGNLLVTGTFEAPNLVRVVTADIEANGFSVSDGVLRANSGLVVSNGMCKINCARAVVGIGTPRVHIEGDGTGSGITFGGTWDSPWNDLTGLIHSRVISEMYGYTTQDQCKEIAHFPPVVPNFRNNSNTLPDSVTPNSNGLLTLENLKLNVVDDAAYNEYVLIKLDELPNVKLVDLYVLFRYTISVPTFYFDEGTFGESPVFHGDSGAFSPSAGTPRLVRMKHIGNDEWIVTYKDLTTWNPPMNTPEEQQ